ncbi:MAG: PAS domain S-box protein [Bacteroidota bacterium]
MVAKPPEWARILPALASLLAAAIGLLVLFAWVIDPRWLLPFSPGSYVMNPTTTIALLLLSGSWWLQRPENPLVKQHWGQVLAGVEVTLAAIRTMEMLGVRTGVNTWLFADKIAQFPDPRHAMTAPFTTICLLLLGLGFLLVGRTLHQYLALAGGAIPLLILTSYAYNSEALAGSYAVRPMSLSAALALLSLSVSLLFARPTTGIMALFTSDHTGGHLFRRALPYFLLIPLLFGWLRLYGETLGLYSTAFGVALLSTLSAGFSIGVLWWNAALIEREESRRLEAEAETGAAHERLEAAFEDAAIGMALVDLDGRFLTVNRALCEMLGYSPAELYSKTVFELTHPEDLELTRRFFEESKEGPPVSKNLEKRYRAKDGRIVWVCLNISTVKDPQGGARYFVGQFQDITQRETAMEALRFSEEKFAKAFRSIPSLVFLSRSEDGRYLEVNDSFLNVLGFERKEVIGHTSLELGTLTPEARARMLEGLRGGGVKNMEMPLKNKKGERLIGLLSAEFIVLNGIQYIVGAINDITELRQVEQERQALQQQQIETLKQADRLKDEFISVISHELRTPLNAVLGFGSLLEDEIAGPLNEQQQDFVRKLLKGGERMLVLIDDLLDYARIQAGRFALTWGESDVPAMIEEIVDSFEPAAGDKKILLCSEVEAKGTVCLDRRRIQQAIANLLSNAIKFTPEGGEVRVRAFFEGESLVVEVSDNGIGIREEDLPKLFNAFRQLDMGLTRRAGGVGLGLSISKAIVEGHGGSIEGSSPGPGQGSTFRFRIPSRERCDLRDPGDLPAA